MIEFKIVTPVYNSQDDIVKCIESVKSQTYEHWHMVVVCDGCTDNTAHNARKVIGDDDRIDLIVLDQNQGHCNSHIVAHNAHTVTCDDVFVHLDGDDHLIDEHVLCYVNNVYTTRKHVWATYGDYKTVSGKTSNCRAVDLKFGIREQIYNNWPFSHLRTFKCPLWHKLSHDDLTSKNGQLFKAAVDVAIFAPVLEMCGDRIIYIKRPLYMYNDMHHNNIHTNTHKLNEQVRSAIELASRPRKCALQTLDF